MWLVSTGKIAGNLPFRLGPGQYLVGRSKEAQIVIKDRTLSKFHARLVCTDKALEVNDLGSLNGTCVNEKRIEQSTAELGSRLRFGSVLCLVAPAAILPAESLDSDSTFAVAGPTEVTIDIEGLTPAQLDVLRFVLRGMDESAIAHRLDRSWHTVHTHLKAIFKQLGVRSRVELMAKLLTNKGDSR